MSSQSRQCEFLVSFITGDRADLCGGPYPPPWPHQMEESDLGKAHAYTCLSFLPFLSSLSPGEIRSCSMLSIKYRSLWAG